MIRPVQGGFVQVQPVWFAAQVKAVFVSMKITAEIEVIQQQVPVLRQRHQFCAHHLICGNASQCFHGMIPHQDFAIFAYRACGYRQILQGLPIVSAQVVQFPGKACELVLIIAQGPLYIADILARATMGHGFEAKMPLDDVSGNGGAEQA